jgi:hypothetical protein
MYFKSNSYIVNRFTNQHLKKFQVLINSNLIQYESVSIK